MLILAFIILSIISLVLAGCYKSCFLDRVNIVSSYDRAVHSPSFEIKLPSVVSLKIMLSLRNGRLLLDLIYFLEISLVVNIVVQLQILLLIICYLAQRRRNYLGECCNCLFKVQFKESKSFISCGEHETYAMAI